MTWNEGKRTCESEYTKMAVPKSDEENAFIQSLKPGQDSCSHLSGNFTVAIYLMGDMIHII